MIFNKTYYREWSLLLQKHWKQKKLARTPIVKLNDKIGFYEQKQALLLKHKLSAKKSFRQTIYKKAQLLSLRKERKIHFILKTGGNINAAETHFIKNEKKRRNKLYINWLYKCSLYLVLISYLFITLYPFIWSIFSSFKVDLEIADGSFNPFPKKWTTENYEQIFSMGDGLMSSWIMNSFIVAFFGTLGNLLFNTFAGYALARINLPGRNKIMWSLLALMMVPGQVGIIPNYLLLKYFKMTNTLYSLIIPAFVNISFIFMSRQFFLKFPKEIEWASRVDGQNRIAFIFRSVMPLMKPMLMTQAVFSFMGFWNNFMVAKMYIETPENYTLTVGIQSILERDANQVSYGQILAGSSISIFPILLLYVVLNSAFMSSNRTDGDK